MIFDPQRRELFVLAPDAARLWLLLEGSLSLDELAVAVADHLGGANDTEVDPLPALLGPLVEAELVRLEEPDATRNRA